MTREPDPVPANLVALHTSDARAVVGVAHAGRMAVERLESHGRHAGSVLGALQRVLQRANVTLRDLDGVVVTRGPGSFTGIRIGLATAQGLAAACQWSVWACDSLRAEAAASVNAHAALAVIQDARRGEVYAALYDVRHGAMREIVAPFCAAPPAAAERLLAHAPAGACAALGSGARLVADVAGRAVGLLGRPGADDIVGALVRLARSGSCQRFEPQQLEPAYLRKSDAEIQRERNP